MFIDGRRMKCRSEPVRQDSGDADQVVDDAHEPARRTGA
jgi:hypothetical protein